MGEETEQGEDGLSYEHWNKEEWGGRVEMGTRGNEGTEEDR